MKLSIYRIQISITYLGMNNNEYFKDFHKSSRRIINILFTYYYYINILLLRRISLILVLALYTEERRDVRVMLNSQTLGQD